MTTKAIHQFVAGYANGDAISNEARVLRALFRQWGYASEIYSDPKRILPELRKETRDYREVTGDVGPDDIVLLHLSVGSPVNDVFPQLNCRKALLYHNITPGSYFKAVNGEVASLLDAGRRELELLKDAAEINLADSAYNASELSELGYRDPQVLPLVLELDRVSAAPNRELLGRFSDGLVNILFVGRCAPNKRIEDLLHAFYYFQRYVEPNSRLIHVGSFDGMYPYYGLLRAQRKDLALQDAEFMGSLPEDQLRASYQCAHLFLSMSEHEGFCIPLLEAMKARLPVLAYASSAVPETMDGAGVLFKEKRFDEVAEMMGRLVRPGSLREAVLAGQDARIKAYEGRNLDEELRKHLAPLLAD